MADDERRCLATLIAECTTEGCPEAGVEWTIHLYGVDGHPMAPHLGNQQPQFFEVPQLRCRGCLNDVMIARGPYPVLPRPPG